MKYQRIFSGKNQKTNMNLSSAGFAHIIVKVKIKVTEFLFSWHLTSAIWT